MIARNLCRKLTAMLMGAVMLSAPILESLPVYAAEAAAMEEGRDESVGTLPGDYDTEEPAGTHDGGAAGTVSAASATEFSSVGGWNESIYAEIAGVTDADVTAVSYLGTAMEGSLTGDDLTYLVRDNGSGGVRIDIPGLKQGTYTLTVKVGANTLTKSGIEVLAYDRSGYAHFNYKEGVGAYKDDGTLKDNAIVLYVTDANKNDVTVTCNGTTVKGIGNILNSVGQECGEAGHEGQCKRTSGKKTYYAQANTNQGIIKKLAQADIPLVVRFIGTVSESGLYERKTFDAKTEGRIDGLTDYDAYGNGGSEGDNGHMARIYSGRNITLEGIGYDATIDGWGFHYMAQSSDPDLGKSFEVRNLTFINTPEDAIGMEGVQKSDNVASDLSASVERCWIHHNEFYAPVIENPVETDKSEGDGSVDFKRGQYFTCSYNYYEGCHKTNLVGSSDKSLQYNLTYHHNYWYMCKARGPLSRNANIHMYNNIFEKQTDFAMNTRANAYIFSEYNLFYACKSPQAVESGAIKSYHDSIASVIWNKGSAGTVVTDKSEYVPNNCQFQARNIKYDKFDTDPEQSYIPTNDYKLDTDFTKLRQVIESQAGVQPQNPTPLEKVTPDQYSVVPRTVTVDVIESLPQESALAKSKIPYAFTVKKPFNLEVAYANAASTPGVLVNEAGENLLEGDGSLRNLPAGTYMIHAVNFQPGTYKYENITDVQFKEITVSTLKLEEYDPGAHYHDWQLDTAKSVAATCTTAGKEFYTCPDCSETKEKAVEALGHSYSEIWTIDIPATEETAGEKSHHCTRCDARTDVTVIPAGSSEGNYHALTFEYNYDDAPEGKTVYALEGTSYASMSALAPAAFTRNGYTLTGLYKDASCTEEVTYPYVVNGKATFYAKWEEGNAPVVTAHSLFFNANGGSTVARVRISTAQIYRITQKSTRDGYTFVGWYDALEGGKLVDMVDGAALKGDMTLYAHWNVAETVTHALDCATDLTAGDITAKTTVKGFTIHALPGGVGSAGKENPKYYMTVKSNGLYTNGVLLPDKSISGNEDGLLKSIEFTTEGSGVLTVEAALSGKEETGKSYRLVLARKAADGSLEEVGSSAITTGTTKDTKEFAVGGAGTYYLYAAGDKGVVYYSLKFTERTYTILYQAGNGKAPEELENGIAVKAGEVIQLLDCTAALGYTFEGWETENDDAVFKDSYTVKPQDAIESIITLSAVYKAMEFTLKYDANGGSLPAGTEESLIVSTGLRITLPACTSASGQKFLGWSIGNTGKLLASGYTVNAADADADKTITLKALYAAEGDQTVYYTVTLDADGGTLVLGGGTERKVAENETINPGQCEKSGYVFKGWTVDGEKVKMPYKVTGNVTLKAAYGLSGSPVIREGIAIIGLEEAYAYTGAKIIPNIGVVDYDIGDGRLLTPGVDYTVKYTNNTKVTTEGNYAKVTVTGKGNYIGKDITKEFRIEAVNKVTENLADLKGASVAAIKPVTYTGAAQYPGFTLKLKGGEPVEYIYNEKAGVYQTADETATPIAANVALSNNVNKGTATILLTGAKDSKGNPTKVKKTFKITAVNLTADKIEVTASAGTYGVKGAVPASITVTYDGVKLKNGTDYTVKYSSNKTAAQDGKITITGKGNYAKKYTGATYAISKLDMAQLKVNAVKAYTGLKAGKVTATVVDKDGNALKPSQYTLTQVVYKADGTTVSDASYQLAAGDKLRIKAVAKDTVNLVENTQTLEAEFAVGSNIAKATVKLNKGADGKTITKVYTGEEITLEASDLTVTIKEKDENNKPVTRTLTLGTDYEIAAYSNNINKGTATAIIKGKGSYSGTKTVRFKIVGKTMKIDAETTWDSISGIIKSFMSGL